MDWEPLVEAAREARGRAYCPFSRFAVGAAVLTADGRIVPGCNVENRTYGLTVCAERVAAAAALAAGAGEIRAVAVVTDTDPPSPPCGSCREVLYELGSADLPVLLINLDGTRRELTVGELLPYPFELPQDR